MRKLFIHVGPTKTGSSAIQALFKEAESRELLYPETGRWSDGSHHGLVFSWRGIDRYGLHDIPLWGQLFKELEREISASDKSILISSEICQAGFVESLLPLVEKYGLNLQLVLVVRDPLMRAASLYNQCVKDPVIGLSETPDEFLTSRKEYFRVQPLYDMWRNVCSELIVVPYSGTLPLVQRFYAALEMSADTEYLDKRYNRSMGGHALVAILIANKLLEKEAERRRFFERLRSDSSFRIWKGGHFPFGNEACRKFLESNRADIIWTSETLKIHLESLSEKQERRFVLSDNDIGNIYLHLEEAGLMRRGRELASSVLDIFSE